MATDKDLIKNVKAAFDFLSTNDVTCAVNSVLQSITEELVMGNRIEIRNFGSLSLRKRKYANQDSYYHTVYYKMSPSVQNKINSTSLR